MFGLGIQELIVILVIVLILFGGKKIPELTQSISQGIRELRRGFSDDANEDSKTKRTKKSTK